MARAASTAPSTRHDWLPGWRVVGRLRGSWPGGRVALWPCGRVAVGGWAGGRGRGRGRVAVAGWPGGRGRGRAVAGMAAN